MNSISQQANLLLLRFDFFVFDLIFLYQFFDNFTKISCQVPCRVVYIKRGLCKFLGIFSLKILVVLWVKFPSQSRQRRSTIRTQFSSEIFLQLHFIPLVIVKLIVTDRFLSELDTIAVNFPLEEKCVLIGFTIFESSINEFFNSELLKIDQGHMIFTANYEEWKTVLIEFWMRFDASLIDIEIFVLDTTNWLPLIQDQKAIWIQGHNNLFFSIFKNCVYPFIPHPNRIFTWFFFLQVPRLIDLDSHYP